MGDPGSMVGAAPVVLGQQPLHQGLVQPQGLGMGWSGGAEARAASKQWQVVGTRTNER